MANDRITQCKYDQAPTMQLHRNSHCCLRSSHTRTKYVSLALSFISEKLAKCAEVRLTSDFRNDAVHPPCGSPNTSRRFELRASKICLVGESPTFSVSFLPPVLFMSNESLPFSITTPRMTVVSSTCVL